MRLHTLENMKFGYVNEGAFFVADECLYQKIDDNTAKRYTNNRWDFERAFHYDTQIVPVDITAANTRKTCVKMD